MEIQQLDTHLKALLHRFEASERKEILCTVAKQIRTNQQKRIAAQQNPDGTSFIPRIARKAKGRMIKRKLFVKMKTARFFKVQVNQDEASIGFSGKTGAIAEIHQHGKVGTVDKKSGIKTRYHQRQLLGLTDEDKAILENEILKRVKD